MMTNASQPSSLRRPELTAEQFSKHVQNINNIAAKNQEPAKANLFNNSAAEDISIKDLVDVATSKNSLYRALTVHGKSTIQIITPAGQLFLPPKRTVRISFLRDLLQGKKSYFTNDEVPYLCI